MTERLTTLGLRGVREMQLHQNRTVMVSVSRSVLRIHRGYAYAPDRILRAVVAFLAPETPSGERREAEEAVLAFPVQRYVTPQLARRKRAGPAKRGDRRLLAALAQLHRKLNERYFRGELADLPFRISDRMRTQLGEVTLEEHTDRVVEISVSRRHLERDDWYEVEKTVLHEMVHQWQAQMGLPVDHGPTFQEKALEVGIEPAARRDVLPALVLNGFQPTED